MIREAPKKYARMVVTNGQDQLTDAFEICVPRLPIIKVTGQEIWEGDKRTRFGLIRFMRDPAQLKDYMRSVIAEKLMLSPRANFMADAAAIKGRADMIVTTNLRDFPAGKLEVWGIEAQHPDEFLTHQFHLSQPTFLQAVRTVRQRLKNPPRSVEEYLDTLRAQGLLATVNAIEPFNQFI